MSPENECSLGKYLAVCGIASRRHAVDLIRRGLVQVNGREERNPASRVSEGDEVVCGGRKAELPERRFYIMLHKPRGYVCTSTDPHAAKKAVDLIRLPGEPRLYSAGRLDKNSEGLILFSNDGAFVHFLTHPGNGVRKTYEVSLARPLRDGDADRMLRGIRSDGETLSALSVERIGERKYRLVLGEGRNREIRRMADSLDNEVVRLKRVAVGGLELGSLPCGSWRELTEAERRSVMTASVPDSR